MQRTAYPGSPLSTFSAGALLLLICIPFFLPLVISVRQHLHRMEMLEKLESSALIDLRLSASEFRWVKKGKEIQTRDGFFDVKNYRQNGDHWHFRACPDQEEELLLKQLAQLPGYEDETSRAELLLGFFSLLEQRFEQQLQCPLLLPVPDIRRNTAMDYSLPKILILVPNPPPDSDC